MIIDIKKWQHDLKTPILAQQVAIKELLTERPGPLTEIQKKFLTSLLETNKDIESSTVCFAETISKYLS